MPTNDLDHYVPSDELRSIILKTTQDRSPGEPVTDDMLARIDQHISLSVRGLISTIGLGLSAENNETWVMTSGGRLNEDTVKCYDMRLPVADEDVPRLMDAIADDLHKYAGHPAMEMASARLESREGELVIVGLITRKKSEFNEWLRATINRLG